MAAEQGQAMKRKETMSTDDFEMPKDRSRLEEAARVHGERIRARRLRKKHARS